MCARTLTTVADVGPQYRLQVATLGIRSVSNDPAAADEQLSKALAVIESAAAGAAEATSRERELRRYDDHDFGELSGAPLPRRAHDGEDDDDDRTARGDDRRRAARVAQRIREELTVLLSQDVGDPRARGVVISAVDVTVQRLPRARVVRGDRRRRRRREGHRGAQGAQAVDRHAAHQARPAAGRAAHADARVPHRYRARGRAAHRRGADEVAQELKATEGKGEG